MAKSEASTEQTVCEVAGCQAAGPALRWIAIGSEGKKRIAVCWKHTEGQLDESMLKRQNTCRWACWRSRREDQTPGRFPPLEEEGRSVYRGFSSGRARRPSAPGPAAPSRYPVQVARTRTCDDRLVKPLRPPNPATAHVGVARRERERRRQRRSRSRPGCVSSSVGR